MDEERRVQPGRPINFDDSYDDSDDNTDDNDEEEEWVPLLRRQNAIRRRGVGTIEDSFVAYQNPFVEVQHTCGLWKLIHASFSCQVSLRLTAWIAESLVSPMAAVLRENIVYLLLISVASFALC